MAARPEPLVLREHERLRGVALAPHEVTALQHARADLSIFATGREGIYDIQASHFVGTVVTRDRRVVIRPKLGMRRVLYLLGYAADQLRFGPPTQLDVEDDLLDVMQSLYAKALEAASAHGIVWDYRDHVDALVSPRGRIDARALVLRRFGVAPPVDCAFNDYTADTEPNRRLVAAASMLTRGSLALTPAGVRLRRTMQSFQDVSRDAVIPTPCATRALGRRWERFRTALSLADVVLSHASLELDHGRVDSIGFLVNMNVCFERFVVEALRRALRLDERRWVHHPPDLALDQGRRLQLVPDAVWYGADGKAQLVVDAKYKQTDRGSVEDVVQVMSYCLALGAKCGVLVYGEAGRERHVIPGPGIEVHVEELSPDGTVDEVEARVVALARHLEGLPKAAG